MENIQLKVSTLQSACIALALIAAPAWGTTVLPVKEAEGSGANAVAMRHLSTDDSLRNLLTHPAFSGFAHLLLPWDGRANDETMTLREIGSVRYQRQQCAGQRL